MRCDIITLAQQIGAQRQNVHRLSPDSGMSAPHGAVETSARRKQNRYAFSAARVC